MRFRKQNFESDVLPVLNVCADSPENSHLSDHVNDFLVQLHCSHDKANRVFFLLLVLADQIQQNTDVVAETCDFISLRTAADAESECSVIFKLLHLRATVYSGLLEIESDLAQLLVDWPRHDGEPKRS